MMASPRARNAPNTPVGTKYATATTPSQMAMPPSTVRLAPNRAAARPNPSAPKIAMNWIARNTIMTWPVVMPSSAVA